MCRILEEHNYIIDIRRPILHLAYVLDVSSMEVRNTRFQCPEQVLSHYKRYDAVWVVQENEDKTYIILFINERHVKERASYFASLRSAGLIDSLISFGREAVSHLSYAKGGIFRLTFEITQSGRALTMRRAEASLLLWTKSCNKTLCRGGGYPPAVARDHREIRGSCINRVNSKKAPGRTTPKGNKGEGCEGGLVIHTIGPNGEWGTSPTLVSRPGFSPNERWRVLECPSRARIPRGDYHHPHPTIISAQWNV
eukprot:Gb_09631 [translate_table: standard]